MTIQELVRCTGNISDYLENGKDEVARWVV